MPAVVRRRYWVWSEASSGVLVPDSDMVGSGESSEDCDSCVIEPFLFFNDVWRAVGRGYEKIL